MAMTDIRTPIPAPDFDPVVIVASCDSCSFDGEVTASVVEDERTWSASAVTYEFECPEGHLNQMRVEDGGDS